MKQQRSPSKSGTNAQILSLDALLALILLLSALLFTGVMLRPAPPILLQLQQTGNDVMFILHNDGVLASLDEETISQALNDTLPSTYRMQVKIGCRTADNITIGIQSSEKYVMGGERLFVTGNDDCIARYTTWRD